MFQNLRWASRARAPYSLPIGLVDGHYVFLQVVVGGINRTTIAAGKFLHVQMHRLLVSFQISCLAESHSTFITDIVLDFRVNQSLVPI